MASLYTHKASNIRRTWLLMTVFLVLVIAIGWAFSWYFNDQFILYIAIGIALVMNFFSYWFSDKVALAATGAKEVSFEQMPELHRMIENLAITAGLPKPRIYVINDSAPNAFATGRNPQHAAVAVTTGLMERLDRTELEGVMAHELSHIGNRDILVMTVAVVLVGVISILADIFLRMSFFGGGEGERKGGALLAILAVVGIIIAPIAGQLMQLAISRRREYLADASGALLTRYPDGLASALAKIGSYAAPMKRANHATAHLFISNPFGSHKAGKFIANMFATHPPIEDRIRVLQGMRS